MDKCYKYYQNVTDIILAELKIIWLGDFPSPVILYLSSDVRILPCIQLKSNKKILKSNNLPMYLTNKNK